MLKISFKNVHNGDSILLEWQENGKTECGIIDCALSKNGTNPIVNYLMDNKIKRIKFAILSHPHTDHYSGFLDLFDYCEKNEATIESFFHTSGFSRKSLVSFFKPDKPSKKEIVETVYLSSVNKQIDKDRLQHFFSTLMKQGNKESEIIFINEVAAISSNYFVIDITEYFKIQFHSPVWEYEVRDYLIKIIDPTATSITVNSLVKNNPSANLLSTFIEITYYKKKVFLLSDVEKRTFKRVMARMKAPIEDVLVMQIPHHGSSNNFGNDDWEPLINSNDNLSVIFSSGKKYNHPGEDVVSYLFKQENIKGLYCTNAVNGYEKKLKEINNNPTQYLNKRFNNISLISQHKKHEDIGDIIIELLKNGKYIIKQQNTEHLFSN